MSLRPVEIVEVVEELAAGLVGAVVQKAFSPSSKRCYLELRQVGRSVLLLLCSEPELARLSVVAERAPSPPEGSAFQGRLRKELVGMKLAALKLAGPREVALTFEKPPVRRTLLVELGGRGDLVLMDEEGRALSAGERRFAVARAPGTERSEPPRAPLPSRLVPQAGAVFPLATAAEALLTGNETQRWGEEARRAALAPLKAKLSRLVRTLEKVRAEANRGPAAEEHRRMGELLSHNLHRLKRGEREVTLTDYTAEGPREVVVTLDPSRTPSDEAERHFQKYRRLLRGSEHARGRLMELEAERAMLEARLNEVAAQAVEELPVPERNANEAPRNAAPSPARPYREFLASSGQRIFVGRGGKENDALTFKVARPQDLWLHARGVPGAHVVIPLEREAEVTTDLLLDAAHLALHNSQAKGEPRGEVSYTLAKFVKKVKGAPGQVTYTREKTFMLRLEPERLARLLKSRD